MATKGRKNHRGPRLSRIGSRLSTGALLFLARRRSEQRQLEGWARAAYKRYFQKRITGPSRVAVQEALLAAATMHNACRVAEAVLCEVGVGPREGKLSGRQIKRALSLLDGLARGTRWLRV